MAQFLPQREQDFVRRRHHGKLSRFRLRGIYAIDSSTIRLAHWHPGCITSGMPYLLDFEKMFLKSV